MKRSAHKIQIQNYFIHPKGKLNVARFKSDSELDSDGCWQERFPIAVCITAKLKKPLTEDTQRLKDLFLAFDFKMLKKKH